MGRKTGKCSASAARGRLSKSRRGGAGQKVGEGVRSGDVQKASWEVRRVVCCQGEAFVAMGALGGVLAGAALSCVAVRRRGGFIQRDGAVAGRRGYQRQGFRKTTGGGARGGVRGSEARPRRVVLLGWGAASFSACAVLSEGQYHLAVWAFGWGWGGVRVWRRGRAECGDASSARERARRAGRTPVECVQPAPHAALTTRVQCVCCWGCCFTVAASDAPPAGCCWLEGLGGGFRGRAARVQRWQAALSDGLGSAVLQPLLPMQPLWLPVQAGA